MVLYISMGDDETADFPKVKAIGETEKALKVVIKDNHYIWVPKSQIHDDSEVYKNGDEGKLIVTLWFAEKNNLL